MQPAETAGQATVIQSIDCIVSKSFRFRQGKKLRVLDLFSGCGGLSLGFSKAGYEIVAAIEMDEVAIQSHAENFHSSCDNAERHKLPRDIQKTDPVNFFKEIGLEGRVEEQIDIIIGGPPCQAFTRVGRAKLRDISSDTNAFLNDPRSQLYKRYLEYVKQLKPLALLMENVPDILNYGGVNIADLVCEDLKKQGYKCHYTLLNTVFYGVPQMRERMFLIAVHDSLNVDISFPQPTHFAELPNGYHGSRSVALKHINPASNPYYLKTPVAVETLSPALTVKDALSDLPVITEHLKGTLKRRIQKLNKLVEYKFPEVTNSFQKLMRSWNGGKKETVSANVIRILPRDYAIFKKMKEGDQYPEALKVAKSIFNRKLRRFEKQLGKELRANTKSYKKLLKDTVPPYDDGKFPNKWRKMEADCPARTLMAHLGKDSYSHIHYDSDQARTISVREAARLQTFPDDFVFVGSMNSAFRQIGNAVPPVMAHQLAMSIKSALS